MNRKYPYYIVFGLSFLTFGLVQDYIIPNYEGGDDLIIYFLGVNLSRAHDITLKMSYIGARCIIFANKLFHL